MVCAVTKQVRTRDRRSCGIAAVQLLSENDGREENYACRTLPLSVNAASDSWRTWHEEQQTLQAAGSYSVQPALING